MVTTLPSPSDFWDQHPSRTELRAYMKAALPGWDSWLTLRAGETQWDVFEDVELLTQEAIVDRLKDLSLRWVQELGPRATLFDPFMQERPAFPLEDPLPATGGDPLPHDIDELRRRPFFLADLENAGAMPSWALIGLLGALGRRQQLRPPGKKGRPGRRSAQDKVAADLLPYCSAQSGLVLPPEPERDSGFDNNNALTAPIPVALVALAAILISLPSRDEVRHKDPKRDPEVLDEPGTLLRDTVRDLNARIAPA